MIYPRKTKTFNFNGAPVGSYKINFITDTSATIVASLHDWYA